MNARCALIAAISLLADAGVLRSAALQPFTRAHSPFRPCRLSSSSRNLLEKT